MGKQTKTDLKYEPRLWLFNDALHQLLGIENKNKDLDPENNHIKNGLPFVIGDINRNGVNRAWEKFNPAKRITALKNKIDVFSRNHEAVIESPESYTILEGEIDSKSVAYFKLTGSEKTPEGLNELLNDKDIIAASALAKRVQSNQKSIATWQAEIDLLTASKDLIDETKVLIEMVRNKQPAKLNAA